MDTSHTCPSRNRWGCVQDLIEVVQKTNKGRGGFWRTKEVTKRFMDTFRIAIARKGHYFYILSRLLYNVNNDHKYAVYLFWSWKTFDGMLAASVSLKVWKGNKETVKADEGEAAIDCTEGHVNQCEPTKTCWAVRFSVHVHIGMHCARMYIVQLLLSFLETVLGCTYVVHWKCLFSF